MYRSSVRCSISALAILFAVASPLFSQEISHPRHLSLNTGILRFEGVTSALAPMVAFRGTSPISSCLGLEVALLAARPEDRSGSGTTVLVTETQLQLFLPVERITPYLGLGTGAFIDMQGQGLGDRGTFLSLSGALGVKGWLNDRFGAQAEFRGRGVGMEMERSSAEYSIGVVGHI
jgi:hypothetical protein